MAYPDGFNSHEALARAYSPTAWEDDEREYPVNTREENEAAREVARIEAEGMIERLERMGYQIVSIPTDHESDTSALDAGWEG